MATEVTNEEILAYLKENFEKVFQETYRIKHAQREEIIDKLDPTYDNVRAIYAEIEGLKEEVKKLRAQVANLR